LCGRSQFGAIVLAQRSHHATKLWKTDTADAEKSLHNASSNYPGRVGHAGVVVITIHVLEIVGALVLVLLFLLVRLWRRI
jgi:hypothetical protein